MTTAALPTRPARPAHRPASRLESEDDRARAFRRARFHSALVGVLRIVFPVCALLSAGLYLVPTSGSIEVKGVKVSFGEIDLSSDNLKMKDPQFDGFTDDQGRYHVQAKSAMQDPKNRDLVQLETIEAKLTEVDQSWAKLVGKSGTYWTKANKLRMTGGIAIETSQGMKAKLETADFFVKQKRIVSTNPVEVQTPNGTIRSQALELMTGERRILFKRKVVAHLTPPPKEAPATAAATAARPAPQAGFDAATLSDGPIDITSDQLEVLDNDKLAIFSGNVRAVQSEATLTASELKVTYSGEPQQGGVPGSSGTEIARIEASQDVLMIMTDGRKASGDTSIYDRVAETMTLAGNVSVSDAGNVITGQRLEMDLAKRITRFPPGARVHALLDPDGAAEGTEEKGKKTKKAATSGKEAGGKPAIGDSFTGFSADAGGATDITADQLEVQDGKGQATFRGNVIALRGGHEIRAAVLDVSFRSPDQKATKLPAGSRASGDISRIKASGRVVVRAPDEQVSTSDWLVYDAAADTITIGGNVVVSQGKNVIKGEKLVVDLKTGQSHFETSENAEASGKKRIRMLINQGKKALDSMANGAGAGSGSGTPP